MRLLLPCSWVLLLLAGAGCGVPPAAPFCLLNAVPNPVVRCPGSPAAATHVGWFCEGTVGIVQVRTGPGEGSVFAEGGPYGDAWTGTWIENPTPFVLVRKSDRFILARLTVEVESKPCPPD